MLRPAILPISTISRLFIHIAIFWLAYELNAILDLYTHSFITDNTNQGMLNQKVIKLALLIAETKMGYPIIFVRDCFEDWER